ncbi:hypothetical protein DXA98_13795 [Lachnospiraceae bacterium OF09-6]|nr:hypothetical protein DXA98_13795 [Lachnospiraceae bacterium OF09-6]
MKELLKNEYKRLLGNEKFIIALGINFVIITLQIMSESFPYYGSGVFVYPLTVFEKWIGGENGSIYPSIFFLLSPLIVAIPYNGTLKQDLKSGYIQNLLCKVKRSDYLKVKYIVVFSTVLIWIFPLIINYFITALLLPTIVPQACSGFFSLTNISVMGNLFYRHPVQYNIIWIIFDIVYGGLIQTAGLWLTFFDKNGYGAILLPFVLEISLYAIAVSTEIYGLAPFTFLQPSQPIPANPQIIAVEMGGLILMSILFFYIGRKRELCI